ncbi:CFEM domain-containing protein [Emericellopsis atlantica]|uniref:CFEM domain-containing protein n=1 Tax=Emericellopsis atlantica TaxID=2614577 RepID=A0A9P8CK87_9HYPO|nr:CFEM domain-containing protein [Emericellopsis atlantica]KAG9249792.1 CFEM domain-containing protein [Emericellopsis atlantica]
MLLFWMLLLFVATLPTALCQGTPDVAAVLDEYPKCAQGCIVDAFFSGICGPTDWLCICTDQDFQGLAMSCVAKSCTIPETLNTQNITATNCFAPVRDNSHQHVVLTIAMVTMSAVFFSIRFFYKIFLRIGFGLDDYLILASFLVTIPSAYITLAGTTKHGLGRDIWTVSHENINTMLKYFYSSVSLYFLEAGLIKLSFIAFYVRIFPRKPTQRLLWGTFWFTAVWTLVYIIVGIFQCRPIRYFWLQWDGLHEGKCINGNRLAWSHAAINITLDLWMLAIPLWELRSLQLHWKKKVGVAIMFCVGTFVTVVSIMRLKSLVHFAATINATWEIHGISFWSTIEVCVGIACACLPSVRLLLVKLFPVLSGTRRATAYYEDQSGGSAKRSSGRRSRGLAIVIADQERGGSMPSSASSAGETWVDSKRGIVYHQTFTVKYSENDESELRTRRGMVNCHNKSTITALKNSAARISVHY